MLIKFGDFLIFFRTNNILYFNYISFVAGLTWCHTILPLAQTCFEASYRNLWRSLPLALWEQDQGLSFFYIFSYFLLAQR